METQSRFSRMFKASRKPVAIGFAAVLALTSVAPTLGNEDSTVSPDDFGRDAYYERWSRIDKPVQEAVADRTWMWGGAPITDEIGEPYAESPDGVRRVQYFDKTRMEVNDPQQNEDDLWYVTNGRLVAEMVEGKFQVGESDFDHSPEPADVRIAGDPGSEYAITYADINELGLRDMPATEEGAALTQTIVDGEVVSDDHFSQYDVTAEERVSVEGLDHTVASVFWDFMNSEDVIWDGEQHVHGDLFPDPFYATGYPITEAYWTQVPVNGVETDVLWQCFERRCLTFTPDNDPDWQVEAGNVGMHYIEWRYEDPGEETIGLPLVKVGVPDAGWRTFGCEDSLVGHEVVIERQFTVEDQVEASFDKLIGYEHDDLYNVFADSESQLEVESVSVDDFHATVNVTGDLPIGGTCDEPRVEEQLRQAALIFDGVTSVDVLHEGEPLTE